MTDQILLYGTDCQYFAQEMEINYVHFENEKLWKMFFLSFQISKKSLHIYFSGKCMGQKHQVLVNEEKKSPAYRPTSGTDLIWLLKTDQEQELLKTVMTECIRPL